MTILETVIVFLLAIIFVLLLTSRPRDIEYGETKEYILKTHGYRRHE